MFEKILIANRGEIACRIIKTARCMGIGTVAVFSDADRDALHVEMADEAVHIGPSQAAQSYLVIDRIIAAARQTGAQAIHPGYGFLSERAAFAEALEAEGIAFIGPNARAITAMGDKIESKKVAAAAHVSTVPGHLGVIESADEAVTIARSVGYPVMIKASAGGGGKGMRIAHDDAGTREGFGLARSEARSSFGDDRVFIEKFIVDPRHIEIQLLADKHGNAVYLGERECSIQRRNQKVIEEAPSPLLDEATRRIMGEQAVALAKAVGYDSAGTVEFVAGQDRSFFFLEMNTRLQVEHPVTELVTGLDLVEQMIRIAAGERLSFTQDDVRLDGWAIESRIYAEDPYREFLPSIGRLTRYRPPAEARHGGVTVRNDTGVVEGSEISIFYDPMIAKLCTHAATREAAIDAMATALDSFVIDGIQHNIPFLSALMDHERWRRGELSTGFIAEEFPGGFQGVSLDEDTLNKLAAVALSMELLRKDRLDRLPGRLGPHPGSWREDWVVKLGGVSFQMQCPSGVSLSPIEVDIVLPGTSSPVVVASNWRPGEPVWTGTIDDEVFVTQVRRSATGYRLLHRGADVVARVLSPRIAALDALMPEKRAADTSKFLLCPMPGLVVSVAVSEGQAVKAGETLAVVEAMKMENVLRAERDLTVQTINAKPGDSLAVDAVIMEFA
ncbi:acetyl/propionyl/methylcrotonyl-CoA carboxylase subunit alpha [Kaistia dalseonensis]|uniref:propionyl-CoA carboxylase n=1 Tax=Kaistia dalseonensis TaxID=410840 RepID=A0ABU0H3G6_9HYPH|nr:acetyl/propionyl/methylcrotonyl-CoA carboxylase subunit alpha [Kaistia dalseonensis]MCX5493457.1 acetyl/propionyl/methylcrotonyl-CoA carboxylase subunit alpha [Kaistia dalseonensis]MDQ0436016.1 propionyl-CoA carboxylase alpha chain [Kaistia dalseonensis]